MKAAHQAHVFHRAVCPENIYVFEGGKAALANFGMAWFIEHSELSFTVNSSVNTKSPYSAPEFLENDVCSSSDIFSLGVIFYELMVGKLPFDSSFTFTTSMAGKLTDDLMPSKVSKDLPEWMDEVVKHTIVADVEERWQDADEFIAFVNNSMEEEQKKTIQTIHATSGGNKEQKVWYLKDMKLGVKVTPSMTLLEILGRGGFGRVFKVWHDMQKQYLAIKICWQNVGIFKLKKS